jgi:hypothetical protein
MDSKQGASEMAIVASSTNVRSSPRTWKNKLRRWGVRKYKNRRQRRSGAVTGIKHTAVERDTLFAYGGAHVASQGESFERRKNCQFTCFRTDVCIFCPVIND